jgi:hypothetical protein
VVNYVVKTDLPPNEVTRIGLEIFKLWVDFAMGRGSIAGRTLVHPTGQYASAIQFRQEGISTVAIIADGIVANVLESGHGRVDLKQKLQSGRAYPMHGARLAQPSSTGLRRSGVASPARLRYSVSAPGGTVRGARLIGGRKSMWATMKATTATGFASFGPNSAPDSWIIPPMAAYSPAANLARMAAQMAKGG